MATALEYGLIAAAISVATITRATDLTLRGSVLAGSRVRLSDGGAEIGTVTADANGNWSVDTSGLTDGIHVISATLIDEAGNTITNLPPRFLVVDATAPVAMAAAAVRRPDGATVGAVTNTRDVSLSGTAEAGATVRLFNGATEIGIATADASGAWSVATTDLADGTHSFTTTVTDAAGNTSAASPVRDLRVDATAPVASPVAAVKKGAVPVDTLTNVRAVTLSGTAEAGATVRLFNGATEIGIATADASGAWSVATTDLADGTHSFTTTVTDAAGNTSAASPTRAVTIDATAPVASPVAAVKKAGAIPIADLTNARAVAVSGMAEAGATVRLFNGATEIGMAVADASGAWSVATTDLADGTHSFTTTVTDAAGNTSAASPTRAVTIDATAPVASSVAAVKKAGAIPIADLTNARAVAVSGTAEAGATVRLFNGATEIGMAIADATGAWSVDATSLADGTYSFTTTVTDAAGNMSAASPVRDLRVDATAPIASPVAAVRKGAVDIDALTNARTVAVSGTAEAGATVRLFNGATEIGIATADASGAWSVDATALADGTHSFTTTVTDVAGNESARSPTRDVTVDATAPAASAVAAVRRGAVDIDALTNARTVAVSGTAEAGATVRLFNGATEIGMAIADTTGAWSVDATGLADGTHSFTTTVTDAAGNTSTASPVRDLRVDATAPTVSAVAAVTRDGGLAVADLTNARTVAVSGTAEAGATVRLFNGATEIGIATADATGAWSVATTDLADGTYSLSTTVTDAAGNTSVASPVRDLTVDATAPVAAPVAAVTTNDGIAIGAITKATAVTLSGTAEADATVRVFDGATEIGMATADANGAWSVAATGLADGTHSFATTVTDAAGNTSAASPLRALTVDTAAPAHSAIAAFSPDSGVAGDGVTKAKTVTLSGTAEAGATVRVFDGTTEIGMATAAASGAWSIEATALAEGPHAFTTTVTDAAGNTSAASAAFGLTVDTDAPVITSNGGGAAASITIRENVKAVTTVAATDARPGALAYEIVGGADRDRFAINGATGALAFLAAPDHERPTDADANNLYDVVVQAKDVDGNVDTQALAVTVRNVSPEAVFGDNGANTFVASADREGFFGLGGPDTVDYALAQAGVTANLSNPFSNRGEAAGDFHVSIENLIGSAFNDKLTGDFRANVLEGGAGGDRLDGSWGKDTASYAGATAGVIADLGKSANNTGEAAGDTYRSIENLLGSDFDDRLVGDRFNNVLRGGNGADTLIANAGNDQLIGGLGPDTMSGGSGKDVFAYFSPNEGADIIQDYVVKDDTLQFSAAGFGGGLVAGQKLIPGVTLIVDTAPSAPTMAGTFLYDTDAQDLSWDVDGSDPGASVKIAHFTSPVALNANDFDIVA